MSYAAKWLGEDKTIVRALPDFPLYKRDKKDDYELVKELHALLSQAKVLIAHNGDRFDLRKANARFIMNGLDPIPPMKTIDTLKIARKHFNFNSNKLDDLGNYLGVGRKLTHTGKALWLACIRGDREAWKTMKAYNEQDTLLLEQIYYKLIPYAENAFNVNILTRETHTCTKPGCGSRIHMKQGTKLTKAGEWQQWQCQKCGGWSKTYLGKLHNSEEFKAVFHQ